MPSPKPDDSNQRRPRLELFTDDKMIRMRCPWCNKKLRIRPIHAGETVRCPKCDQQVRVPGTLRERATVDLPTSRDEPLLRRMRKSWRLVALIAAGVLVLAWVIGRLIWR